MDEISYQEERRRLRSDPPGRVSEASALRDILEAAESGSEHDDESFWFDALIKIEKIARRALEDKKGG